MAQTVKSNLGKFDLLPLQSNRSEEVPNDILVSRACMNDRSATNFTRNKEFENEKVTVLCQQHFGPFSQTKHP